VAELAGRHLLLLQGPAGPFFARVARQFRAAGAQVTKINFNGGEDFYFRGPGIVRYTGARADFPAFFEQIVREKGIDGVVLFGDCRPLHRLAIVRAKQLGIPVHVFEEGYLRPDYVTFERGGVNGHSDIPRDPKAFPELAATAETPRPKIKHAFFKSAIHTIVYACATALAKKRYPLYQHHRDIRPFVQMWLWIRGGGRRIVHTLRDRPLTARLEAQRMPPYFFVPLQVHLDSQLSHSRYATIDDFIREVVRTFAEHAPRDHALILKLHPMDRAYRDYSPVIDELSRELGLEQRLFYADIINLPAALRGARGTVVINSTVGLSSLHHGTPVKCLGRAIYDIDGLTHQGSLAEFFRDPGQVDRTLYLRFRQWLLAHNQLSGSVWSRLNDDPSRLVR